MGGRNRDWGWRGWKVSEYTGMNTRGTAMIARFVCVTAVSLAALVCLQTSQAQRAEHRSVGQTGQGYLLPNGWTLSRGGEQITLTHMPLNIVPLADGKQVLVACSGY